MLRCMRLDQPLPHFTVWDGIDQCHQSLIVAGSPLSFLCGSFQYSRYMLSTRHWIAPAMATLSRPISSPSCRPYRLSYIHNGSDPWLVHMPMAQENRLCYHYLPLLKGSRTEQEKKHEEGYYLTCSGHIRTQFGHLMLRYHQKGHFWVLTRKKLQSKTTLWSSFRGTTLQHVLDAGLWAMRETASLMYSESIPTQPK